MSRHSIVKQMSCHLLLFTKLTPFDSQPKHRPGVAIGSYVLDLSLVWNQLKGITLSEQELKNVFTADSLNSLMGKSHIVWHEVRSAIKDLLSGKNPVLKNNESGLKDKALIPLTDVIMHLPCKIGDYTDFYSSLEHATNVGKMFRPNADALLPNWKHLPVGYHGRASSIIVSGTEIHRPLGQTRPKDDEPPVFGPCKRLDFELEVGFFVGGEENKLGHPIPISQVDQHIFGMVLMNDWSARDIQKWEYVPLGPFLAKNFATTISPWIIPIEALEPFKVPTVKQDPLPLPYLRCSEDCNYDIDLFVDIVPAGKDTKTRIVKSNFKYIYWTMKQQLAHHSISGCNMKPGDLLASGTVSGPTQDSFGSMLELTWSASKPITLQDGSTRTFIEDGDQVILSGEAKNKEKGIKIAFGDCSGIVLPSVSFNP